MTTRTKMRRGSGIKLTLPFVLWYSTLWFIVLVVTVPVFSVASYLTMADVLPEEGRRNLIFVLVTRTPLLILTVAGLAIFTTHRLAGPFIALKRAFDDVREGNIDRVLRFRRSDAHLRGVEDSFNGMMEAMRSKVRGEKAPERAASERT